MKLWDTVNMVCFLVGLVGLVVSMFLYPPAVLFLFGWVLLVLFSRLRHARAVAQAKRLERAQRNERAGIPRD